MDTTTVVSPKSTVKKAQAPHRKLQKCLSGMQRLLNNEESNAFKLGQLVNAIEDEGLATACGYPSTRKCLTLKLKGVNDDKVRTFWRYARVAKHFTLEQAKQFGVSNLDLLVTYELDTHNRVLPGDPGEHEVVVLQDSSTVAKKFRDCSCLDFRKRSRAAVEANQDNAESAPTAIAAAVSALPPAAKPVGVPINAVTNAVKSAGPVQLLTLGAVVTFIGEWLHGSIVGWIVVGLGSAICLFAAAILVRHLAAAHAEWSRALEGLVKPLVHFTQRFSRSGRTAESKPENKEPPTQTPKLAA